jgi:hypothetical protein
MTDFAPGGIKLTGLNPKQSIGSPKETGNIQLTGIDWNTNATTQQNTANTNWNNDGAKITRQNYGTVPANDDLPPIFDSQPTVTGQGTQVVQSAVVGDPAATQGKDNGLSTGIGMAVGAVGGFILGRGTKLGVKLGIGIGLAVGGLIGNHFEN